MLSLTNFYFMVINNLCKKGKKEKAFVKVNKSLVFLKKSILLRKQFLLKKIAFFYSIKRKKNFLIKRRFEKFIPKKFIFNILKGKRKIVFRRYISFQKKKINLKNNFIKNRLIRVIPKKKNSNIISTKHKNKILNKFVNYKDFFLNNIFFSTLLKIKLFF